MQVRDTVRGAGGRAEMYLVDVSDAAAVEAVCRQVIG